jgi:hypothetical protein
MIEIGVVYIARSDRCQDYWQRYECFVRVVLEVLQRDSVLIRRTSPDKCSSEFQELTCCVSLGKSACVLSLMKVASV